ncbi:MAG: aminotransferase class I/II-fold pyridoxal phosphate-dependent enzyme [Imperialibacter sp.]|uniref:aminotransferase class I/II-fold pyridoxal phosphate-dependent enzyme n=1 Tax=Imperialibacter sp. TaxID=2038411 RepID=UPI0032EF084D
MAKTRHNHLLDTIDEIITNAKKKGIVHLYSQDESLTGNTLTINDQQLNHFGTCGYLGLEQDMRLKQAVADAVMSYGTQFPMSKTYVSSSLYTRLESLMSQMYENKPVVLTKNSTIGHITVIPSIIREDDLVIMDQQVHASVQSAVQLLKAKGVSVEIVRHSRMDLLEEKIKEAGNKYNRIWYMADGVYSMYGDFAPIKEMVALAEKYSRLYLYVDDAHGMSWAGPHGSGYISGQVGMHHKMVFCGTMGKSFGVSGGVIVFPEEEMQRKVKIFGGPLTFSVQIEPPMLAACIASAEIHLSDEIKIMQHELAEKISYCNYLISQTNLPLVEENQCPIFFIGTGMPATGYNFVKRMMDDGYYVNLGVFPAVPVKNTGVRFTISRHNKLEDIKGLVEAMEYHYPKALEDENRTPNEVRKAFRLPLIEEGAAWGIKKAKSDLGLTYEKTIGKFSEPEWNSLMRADMSFDYKGIEYLEKAFSGNPRDEENWDFHYLMIKDSKGKAILSTFLTSTVCKDDMFSRPEVSRAIEAERKLNPYYLTSRSMVMGSLVTEGVHFYLDKSHANWKDAVTMMVEKLSQIQDKENIASIYLRDFYDDDAELRELLQDLGYVKVDFPETCIVKNLAWNDREEFLQGLSKKSRRHIKYDVLPYENFFDVEIKSNPSADELRQYKKLFQNVKDRNLAINAFDYPEKFFLSMAGQAGWEFIVLRLKPELNETSEMVGVAFNYRNQDDIYCGLILGMNYDYLEKYSTYRQLIHNTLLRAKELGCSKLRLGLSASMEKKKFGATVKPMIAFAQVKDNYNMEAIEQVTVSQA